MARAIAIRRATRSRSARTRAGAGVVGGGRRRLAAMCADGRKERPRKLVEVLVRKHPNGSTVAIELALRPAFPPQARMPPPARSASRGERHGLLVLTAGPVACSTGVTPPARWPRPNLPKRAGFLSLSLRVAPNRGLGRREEMTRAEHEPALRRRDEFARDRRSPKAAPTRASRSPGSWSTRHASS